MATTTAPVLARVISGGQTGVDIAALRAAKACGIPTGGWMPRGWRTLTGARPEYHELYGMQEQSLVEYSVRTFANVADAHVTLRIASDWGSRGVRCTRRCIRELDRPHLDLSVGALPLPTWTAEWLHRYGPGLVLNVAGNSEQTAPGIEAAAEAYLRRVFALLVPGKLREMPEGR
jgi:hypothetical protein